MKLLGAVLLLCLIYSLWQQPSACSQASSSVLPEVQTVDFCELLGSPQLYDQKIVRTRAIFRYGGEDTSDLYCPGCSGAGWGRVRPSFDESYETYTKPEVVAKLSRQKHSSGTVKVVIVGKFYSGPDGGHGFHIQRVERAEYISKDYQLPTSDSPKALRRLRCE